MTSGAQTGNSDKDLLISTASSKVEKTKQNYMYQMSPSNDLSSLQLQAEMMQFH
jgi:hypothetical protein